ncbi:MAG TPA: autotransporter, partial [Thermoanaerobaculia bacterium]|nr:autotransporter [Thermoanaerobaculia bacterium]
MRKPAAASTWLLASFFVLLAALAAVPAAAQQPPAAQPAAQDVTPDPWPKTAALGGATYALYQPQRDGWDSYTFAAHAAVSVQAPGAKEPVFGVIWVTAKTRVDGQARSVELVGLTVTKVNFPSAPAQAAQYQKDFQALLTKGPATLPLDRLQSELAIAGAEKKARTVPLKNAPPKFVFTEKPAVLVLIDGDPVWTPVKGTSLQRVLNTRALVLSDSAGNIYVHVLDGFETAMAFAGPWRVAASVPDGAAAAADSLAKANVVDLMRGEPDATTKQWPSLKSGAPDIVVATTPTELVVTQGPPDWAPLEKTQLLYVTNTTGNVFRDLYDQQIYVLATGRWFRSFQLAGPWEYVKGKDLPVDFAMIPDDSPKENVKASVPGTAQAAEAVIANQVPHSASVNRLTAKFTPALAGPPQMAPIEGTTLSYVANSPTPIIKVSDQDWYACQGGVWFAASSLPGPWAVAAYVPAVIYTIPPSSSLHYVTYVQVYEATPTTVVAGYTPGYLGTAVSTDGVVVYGTGYAYPSYVDSAVWYPAPVTYGYAANPTWTPWTGWAVGFGFGLAAGAAAWGCAPYWGPMPYAYGGYGAAYGAYGGAAAWGPGGWAATSGNMYHQYGATSAVSRTSAGYNAWTGNAWSSKVGTSYNSVTGRASAGQSASVANAYTGGYAYGNRGATYNPNTGVAAAGGRATVGNAYTGQQTTVGRAAVSGPGGQTTHMQQVGNNYYAERDGNVYKDTGSGFQKYNGDGSWSNVSHEGTNQS